MTKRDGGGGHVAGVAAEWRHGWKGVRRKGCGESHIYEMVVSGGSGVGHATQRRAPNAPKQLGERGVKGATEPRTRAVRVHTKSMAVKHRHGYRPLPFA